MKTGFILLAAGGMLLTPVVRGDLIFYYNFDDDTMTNQGSGSATLNNIPTAASYIDGAPGFGRAFNSANNHPWASPGIGGGLTMDQLTVSVMMRSSGLDSWDDFWSIYDGTNHMYLETNGSNSASVFGTTPTYFDTNNLSSTENIEDGEWHFLTMTADVGTDTSKLYIDGELKNTQGWNWTGTVSQFQLTSRLFDSARALTADIDEFRIYDEALSATEVADLMTAIPEPTSLGLFGLFGILLCAGRSYFRRF
jgi:hypothetical protein